MQFANELVDVIHYAFAIAALNEIDVNSIFYEMEYENDKRDLFVRFI